MDRPRHMPDEAVLALLERELGLRPAELAPRRVRARSLVCETGELVVKCAFGADAAARLAREAEILALLPDDLPAAVPRPVLVAAAPAVLVCRRLPGRAPVHGAWDALPAAAQDRLAGDLGRFMAALHAAPLRLPPALPGTERGTVGGEVGGPFPSPALPAPRRLKRALAGWRQAARTDPSGGGMPAVAIHNDLNIGNLLIDGAGRLTGVVDFEVARHAPAVLDFRKFWQYGTRFRDGVIGAYVGAGGAPPDPELLACAEARLLMKFARLARGGDPAAAARFGALAQQRLAMERAAWRRKFLAGFRRPGAQARPMAETVATQTME